MNKNRDYKIMCIALALALILTVVFYETKYSNLKVNKLDFDLEAMKLGEPLSISEVPNNIPRPFSSSILGIYFDYPGWWGELGEEIREPDFKTNYVHWALTGKPELNFQTITKDITPYKWENVEVFKYTEQKIEDLCGSLSFINLEHLENRKIECEIAKNENGVSYVKYQISYHISYETGYDFIKNGILLKTKSNEFPMLAVYYNSNNNKEGVEYLDMIISSLSYGTLPQ